MTSTATFLPLPASLLRHSQRFFVAWAILYIPTLCSPITKFPMPSKLSKEELYDAFDNMSTTTARAIPSDCSIISQVDDYWYDAGDHKAFKAKEPIQKGTLKFSKANPKPSTSYEWSETAHLSSTESNADLDSSNQKATPKDPPSYYHFQEMNKGPVKLVTRLAPVPSQYHLAELRDYPALTSNQYMLKLATSKCVLHDSPRTVTSAHSDYIEQ